MGFKARPTIDIDLLGERINNDRDNLKEVFLKKCAPLNVRTFGGKHS